MGAITDLLKSLPLTAVQAEKIKEIESQLEVLKTEKKELHSQLDAARLENNQLKKELAEELQFVRGVEFRRSRKTGGVWLPFCPKCGMPIDEDHRSVESYVTCMSCGWFTRVPSMELHDLIGSLPK